MTNRRLKKSVVPILYGIAIMMTILSIYMIERMTSASFKEPKDTSTYVDETIFDQEQPVVGSDITLLRPYTDKELKVLKDFYDYKAEAVKQQNSLIYHEGTYLQNSGVAYGGKDNFDIISVLDGTVIEVKEDQLLGNIIQIRHSNDMISVYQSLSSTKVKKDDVVKQGQIIGKSGLSNISKELGSHLHFELIRKGEIVNPELYFGKLVSEL